MEDSTFRAYRNNPKFLNSILPLSAELDFILSRVFECDPRKRINIPDLRSLILGCSRFTTRSIGSFPPTPPPEPAYAPELTFQVVQESLHPSEQYPSLGTPLITPLYTHPVSTQFSTSSRGSSISDAGSAFSAGSSSSMSSCGSYEEGSKIQEVIDTAPTHTTPTYTAPQSKPQFYGQCRPMDPVSAPWMPHHFMAPVQVY